MPIPEYLSVSQVQLLKTCPRKYAFKYIEELPEEKSKALSVGTAFHKAISGLEEEAYRDVDAIEPGKYPHRQVLRRMKASYDQATRELPPVKSSEVKFESAVGATPIVGYVDAIRGDANGNWYVSEAKTAAKLDDAKKLMLGYDLQLCTYAYAAHFNAVGLNPEHFRGMYYTTTVKPPEKLKKTEEHDQYVMRATFETHVWHIPAPEKAVVKNIVETEFAFARHIKEEVQAYAMLGGALAVPGNQLNCKQYNSYCTFFERCYGHKPPSAIKPASEEGNE